MKENNYELYNKPHDYLEEETLDILDYFRSMYNRDDLMQKLDDPNDREKIIKSLLLYPDITGNKNEPYSGLTNDGQDANYKAEEYLLHNSKTLIEAIGFIDAFYSSFFNDFNYVDLLENAWKCDVAMRLYFFDEAFDNAVERYKNNG